MSVHKIEIPITGLFSPKECLWFLDRGFDDCMYKVYPDKVRRAFRSGEEIMLVDIFPLPDKLVIEWLTGEPSGSGIKTVISFVKDWFDLGTDITLFYKTLAANPNLAYMQQEFMGLKFMSMPDLFEALAWCIIGQQINLTFAYKIKRRLVEFYGTVMQFDGESYYLFPTPSILAVARMEQLRAMQFSVKKAEYLVTVAEAFTAGTLNKTVLMEMPDQADKIRYLTSLRGIGLWTANYVLMKSLKEPSCIPHGDAGLLNALIGHQIIKDKTDAAAIERLFEKFRGWESYLVFYLWRSLADNPKV